MTCSNRKEVPCPTITIRGWECTKSAWHGGVETLFDVVMHANGYAALSAEEMEELNNRLNAEVNIFFSKQAPFKMASDPNEACRWRVKLIDRSGYAWFLCKDAKWSVLKEPGSLFCSKEHASNMLRVAREMKTFDCKDRIKFVRVRTKAKA